MSGSSYGGRKISSRRARYISREQLLAKILCAAEWKIQFEHFRHKISAAKHLKEVSEAASAPSMHYLSARVKSQEGI